MITIGILREEKSPPDKRVPLSPEQCKALLTHYSELKLVVQPSDIRCFKDEEYEQEGITLSEDLSHCDILLGVKEVPKSHLIANKTYLFFSHTIKKQAYNRALLQKMVEKHIRMIDYETLTYSGGGRLLGFGRYAGVVGAYNGFLAYGLRTKRFNLKPAYQCADRTELEQELKKVSLPNIKVILSGKGRVGQGALEIVRHLNIKEVTIDQFKSQYFDEAVFVHVDFPDYNARIDGSDFVNQVFFDSPHLFKSTFMDLAKHADVFIAGHFYAAGSPYLFSREDAKSTDFKIRTLADISCDIDGPIASTIRPSTIAEPIYGYNPMTESEDDFEKEDVITVMAVDNLPCELPKDASADFGDSLIKSVLPLFFSTDEDDILSRATICESGDLTPHFEYLRDYLNGH
ncbi:MAG: NAD(P)-dependent oxidoreductase [Flavobacteriales bacterium]